MSRRRRWSCGAQAVTALVFTGLARCSAPSHPPAYDPAVGEPPAASQSAPDCGAGANSAPEDPSTEGMCGNQVIPAVGPAPTLYFVLDRSGSMGEVVDGASKFAAISRSVVQVVRTLGSRARFGAAVFPDPRLGNDPSVEACSVGNEVFPARAGDAPATQTCRIGDGPVTRAFAASIALPAAIPPLGGTPVAATLARLAPSLAALGGKTVLLLATDGGPNCNFDATCEVDRCIPNIEQAASCAPPINCCRDRPDYGPTACLDDDEAVRAVEALHTAGIATYVIGIPGSAPYASVLDRLARAGGTARAGAPAYYDVRSIRELDATLSTIAATVLLDCHLDLDDAPPDPGFVNVYFDRRVVAYGAPDGWVWSSDATDRADAAAPGDASDDASDASDAATGVAAPGGASRAITLLGASCSALESGQVREVQIVSGCPTQIPR